MTENKKLEEILEAHRDDCDVNCTEQFPCNEAIRIEQAFAAGRFCQLCKKTDDNVGYACVRCFQESNKQAEQKGKQDVFDFIKLKRENEVCKGKTTDKFWVHLDYETIKSIKNRFGVK